VRSPDLIFLFVEAHEGHGLLAKIKGNRTTPAVNQLADHIRENYKIRRARNPL
jgi:phosphoglycerol transferase MdoB-like AlkP superfamily enzyme